MRIINFIKQNKILSVIALLVFVVIVVFIVALTSSKQTTTTIPFIPTPTKVLQNDQPVPTLPETVQEVPEGGIPESWILQLPLKNEFYYVEYNGDKNTIIGHLYPMYSFSVPKQDQVVFLKDKITKQLEGLGVNTSKVKIVWDVAN